MINSNGQKFYISPSSKQGYWIDPVFFLPQNIQHLRPEMIDAIDASDMSDSEVLAMTN